MCRVVVGRSLVLVDARFSGYDHSGDDWSLAGTIAGDAADLTHSIDQIRALTDSPGEPFVPVVTVPCAAAHQHLATADGYYRVLSASVSRDALTLAVVTLTLRRVQGYAQPMFESVVIGGKRGGVAAAVAAQAWQALPSSVAGYENGVITPTVETAASETGPLTVFTDTNNQLFNGRVDFFLPPAAWYAGAAQLLMSGRVVTGRQIPHNPTGWMVTNGRVRLAGVPTSGQIAVERWTGAAWQTLGSYWFGQYGGGAQPLLSLPPHSVTVIRNDPACVTIRLAYDAASIVTNARFAVTVDVSLRRGATCAEVYLSTRGAYRWLVRTPIAYAGAVTSTAGRATADPTTGAAYAIGNTESIEPSSPRAFALPTAETWLACGIGWVPGTVNEPAVQTFGRRHAAAQSERVAVVTR